jgi:hypothetical protein
MLLPYLVRRLHLSLPSFEPSILYALFSYRFLLGDED